MIRFAVCLLIVLTTTSFQINNNNQQVESSGLLSKIGAARQQVQEERVQILKGTVGTRRVRVGRRSYEDVPVTGIIGREMALAVMNSEGEIQTVRAIKRDSAFEVLTPGFVISMRRENGINTDFACIDPPGGKVLAVKYPVSNEGSRFGPGDAVIEAVYTPYSAEIKTEEVIRRGIEVQDEFIKSAYARLAERGIMSRAFPGRRVVDVIPTDVLRVLLMNEHIDPGEFKSEGLTRPLVERVLTVIATNGEKAYAYSVSSAGARGLVQMIPSTYSLIANLYPAAGLKSNFSQGMADPINAVVAQVLLCDSDWQTIKTRSHISADRIGPYLAAAYNGGVGRVLSILAHNETDWMDEPDVNRKPTKTVSERVAVKVRTRRGRTATKYILKSYTQPIFKSETSKYVSQYHWINDYFIGRGEDGPK
ncbi:MAG TPA: hypothetical protein VNI02_17830, partial [Blastocatellia bacterium]|nr:hypothetical protein [Blastocatellia bacterium]